jgi:Phasin protein
MPDEGKAPRAAAAKSQAADWGAGLFEANQEACGRWLQGLVALSQEVAQFMQSRLQEDMAAWMALASLRHPEEAMKCQQRFVERTVAHYADEIAKLSQMMFTLGSEGLSSLPRKERRIE